MPILQIAELERIKREEAYRKTLATLRLEGLEMDRQATRTFRRHVDGKITFEQLRAALHDLNERKFRPVSVSRNGRS